MNLISQNPYRILGLLVGTPLKDHERQIRRLRQFIEVGQDPDDDFFIPNLFGDYIEDVNRTLEEIDLAVIKLGTDKDKLIHSFFWFSNFNKIIDESAIEDLKTINIDDARDKWNRSIVNKEISDKNISCFINHNLVKTISDLPTEPDVEIIENFLTSIFEIIESDSFDSYKSKIVDSTFKENVISIELEVINKLKLEIEESEIIGTDDFHDILSNLDFESKSVYFENLSLTIISYLENSINNYSEKQKTQKSRLVTITNEFLADIKDDYKLLISSKSVSSLKINSISDKIALELFTCGKEYFQLNKDSEKDPGENTLKIYKKALSFAKGNIAKERIKENITKLEEWVREAHSRSKQKNIKLELVSLISILKDYEDNIVETIYNANNLITKLTPLLAKMKSELGANDEFYLKLSTKSVSLIQQFIISEVNEAQENLELKLARDRFGTINKLKTTLKNAWDITLKLEKMDMESTYRSNRFNSNKASLKDLCKDLGISTTTSSASSFSSSSSSTSTSNSKPTSSYKPQSSTNSNSSNSGCLNIYTILGGIGFVIGCASGEIVGGIVGAFVGIGLASKIEGN